jgi:hypothetical protein
MFDSYHTISGLSLLLTLVQLDTNVYDVNSVKHTIDKLTFNVYIVTTFYLYNIVIMNSKFKQ